VGGDIVFGKWILLNKIFPIGVDLLNTKYEREHHEISIYVRNFL